MTPLFRLALAPCLVVFATISTLSAATITWNNPLIGSWNDPNNWVDTNGAPAVPVAGDDARIHNGGTAVIDAGQNVQTTFAILASNTGQTGNLQISGGSLTTLSDIRIGNGGAAGGTGRIDMTGGAITQSGGNLNVGFGDTAVGTFDMSAGSLLINAGGILAVGNRGTGIFNQSGGSIYVRNTAGSSQVNLGRNGTVAANNPGRSSGDYTLSGGSLTAASLRYGNAVGTNVGSINSFNLQGGALTVSNIAIINTAAANTFRFTGGELTALVVGLSLTNNGGTLSPASLNYGSAGVAPATAAEVVTSQVGTMTFINNSSYNQGITANLSLDLANGANDFVSLSAAATATLAGTISVNLVGGYDPAVGTTFDVLTAGTITDLTAILGQTSSGNTFNSTVVPGGNGQLLRLTVVPEPGTYALIGMGAAAFLFRARFSRGKR